MPTSPSQKREISIGRNAGSIKDAMYIRMDAKSLLWIKKRALAEETFVGNIVEALVATGITQKDTLKGYLKKQVRKEKRRKAVIEKKRLANNAQARRIERAAKKKQADKIKKAKAKKKKK